jgi:hypothetical protein
MAMGADAIQPRDTSEKARRVGVTKKADLMARLDRIDPQKLVAIRFRTRIADDSFGDSFADSFGDSFADSFGDSFGDSFSDSSARLQAELLLERMRAVDPATVVGVEFKLHE